MDMSDPVASDRMLPRGFEHLQDLVPEWTKPTEHERRERRATSSMSALRSYHARLSPTIEGIARHLDAFPMGPSLPLPELWLLQLAQMYMEVAWAVEVLDAPEEPDQVPRERWQITVLRSQVIQPATSPDSGALRRDI